MQLLKSIFIATMLGFISIAAWADDNHEHPPGSQHLVFSNNVHALAWWTNGPHLSVESFLKIQWRNSESHSIIDPPGDFKVDLFMPSMGHGSAPTQIEREVDQQGDPVVGEFIISSIFFIMSGDWEVNITLTTPDGKKETQSFPVHLTNDVHY